MHDYNLGQEVGGQNSTTTSPPIAQPLEAECPGGPTGEPVASSVRARAAFASPRREALRGVSGMLVVHKPRGMISKDVSRWLERRVGKVKLGHVGTLDPMAEGVLPLLVGGATRLQDFLLELPKSYAFEITLGKETDTLDTDGDVVREATFEHVSKEQVELALPAFTGEQMQTPPIFSAVKFKGRPLYEYARAGTDAQVPLAEMGRKVTIFKIDLLDFRPGFMSLRIECSKGTYVRSLVRDLCVALGTVGTLSRLVREKSSGFCLEQSHSLEKIEANLDDLKSLVVSTSDFPLLGKRWVVPYTDAVKRLQNGQTVKVSQRDFFGIGEQGPVENDRDLLGERVLLIEDGVGIFGLGSFRVDGDGWVTVAVRRGLN